MKWKFHLEKMQSRNQSEEDIILMYESIFTGSVNGFSVIV